MPDEKIYFSPDITERERACFETGIKLGALYHILCGIPISNNEKVIADIEKGIESAISCQPYVESVKIMINREKIVGDKSTPFNYDEITGKIIQAQLIIQYNSIKVSAKIEWVEDLKYPLMYIEDINLSD